MGPTVLRGKGLYDSDRNRRRVAWKPQWGGGVVTLSPLSFLFKFPLLVLITASLLERKGWGFLHGTLAKAQMVTLLSLREMENATEVLTICSLAMGT